MTVYLHAGTIAFVGSHLDVVPANPETWERNPFKLAVEVHVFHTVIFCSCDDYVAIAC